MRIHFFVEGPSDKIFIDEIFRKICPSHKHSVYQHAGVGKLPGNFEKKADPKKTGLLDQLPSKIRAFSVTARAETDRFIVLVDTDDKLEYYINRFKEFTDWIRGNYQNIIFEVCFAIEETEAFYLGDVLALRKAYKTIDSSALKRYEQDSICGTWEILQKVLKQNSENKVEWAQMISPHLNLDLKGSKINKSKSFLEFLEKLHEVN